MQALARSQLSDLIADFVAYFGGDPRGHGTTRAYADDLRQFLAVAGSHGVRRLGQVDRAVMYRYLADLREKGYQPETIHRRLASLQSFFRYLATERDWGAIRRCVFVNRGDPIPSQRRTSGTRRSRCSTKSRPRHRSGYVTGAC